MNQSSFISSITRFGAPMVLLLFVAAQDARSDETPPHAPPCEGVNEIDMNACFSDRARKIETRLSETYRQLFAALEGKPGQVLLKKSQEAWVRFRCLDCKYYVSGLSQNAPIQTHISTDLTLCEMARAETRIKELQDFIACTNNGCPQEIARGQFHR
jgi:uncharacterized protein YecT (DUF1311 family)